MLGEPLAAVAERPVECLRAEGTARLDPLGLVELGEHGRSPAGAFLRVPLGRPGAAVVRCNGRWTRNSGHGLKCRSRRPSRRRGRRVVVSGAVSRLAAIVPLIVGLIGLLSLSTTADAQPALQGVTASIITPPTVQHAGLRYFLTITVRTRAQAVRPFCIDFDDDHNSWLFQFRASHVYKKDVYCFKGLRAHYRKSFRIGLIPARTGQHKLGITIGRAEFFPTINEAVMKPGSLSWSDNFVIVS
jgi:hypothetical protein